MILFNVKCRVKNQLEYDPTFRFLKGFLLIGHQTEGKRLPGLVKGYWNGLMTLYYRAPVSLLL